MDIVPYSENLVPKWDKFCRESRSAWFFHTSHWLKFNLAYDVTNEFVNRSFAVMDGSTMLAIVPLIEKPIEDSPYREISFCGVNCPCPAFSNDLGPKHRGKIESKIFEEILKLESIDYLCFLVYPLTEDFLSKHIITNPLLKFGFHDTTITTNILELGKEEESLFRSIRKGHKSDIKTASNNDYQVEIIDSENFDDEKFDKYREIHLNAAGRQTRPDITWEMMRQWVESDLAVLVLCSKARLYVSANLVIIYKEKAYYASGGILQAYMRERGIGHLMQWETIKYLDENGFTHYELGWDWYANISQEVTDQKMLGISRFKAGFGANKYPLFRGEYFLNEDYMRKIYSERLKKYFAMKQG